MHSFHVFFHSSFEMKSKFTGVTLDSRKQKWKAQIFIARKNRNLGCFDTEEEAARMWDSVRVQLGDFFKEPVPTLNCGYDQLLDPYQTADLRQRLLEEGAAQFEHAYLGKKSQESPKAAEPRSNQIETGDRSRELLKEAAELSQRLTNLLQTLATHFHPQIKTSSEELN
jgi:hypothetical protein